MIWEGRRIVSNGSTPLVEEEYLILDLEPVSVNE